jgi:hypothetical protein
LYRTPAAAERRASGARMLEEPQDKGPRTRVLF